MPENNPFAKLFKLKDAIDDPGANLESAKADPELGPILNKLSSSDLETLRKLISNVKPLSFCNGPK